MNPDTLNQEIHETQIEIQNELKTTETENSEKNNTNTVRVCEEEKVGNKNVQPNNAQVNINNNLEKNVGKEPIRYGYFGGNQRGKNLPEYWVQFNFQSGSRIPNGGGMPLYYEPDRNLFVKIVFSIVLFMLILTAGFVMFVYMTEVKHLFLEFGMMIMIVGMVGMLSLNYAMMCSPCTRTPPCNFICLFLAVCFMSLIAAYVTVRYRTQIIFLALMATTVTVIVCLCLACTRFDFTQYLLYVIVIATAFGAIAMIVGITMVLTNTRYKPLTLVILIIGTILNVVILVMELQMILGGRTVELSEDDYALGAFMLYTSIVDIFLKLVHILGIFDSD